MLEPLNGVPRNLGYMDWLTEPTTTKVSVSRLSIESLKGVTREIGKNGIVHRHHRGEDPSPGQKPGIDDVHAGDAGKGFVVISKDVRTLSGQISEAAVDIGRKLTNIEGRNPHTAEAMAGILEIVEEVNSMNRSFITIAEENRSISDSVRERSKCAAAAVEGVSRDIGEAPGGTGRLSDLGRTVKSDLERMK